ncbi:hypothetical protein KXX58_003597 [Aspergillus fumigatus]|nr:hypothetical protein KXX14_003979 [Aspergillus fumigatus]KAH1451971.1 hypothetical protein KXX58_003597 [Aspergillus fumigatus]KAH1582575.1 hypothetical protein KXX69_002089 [Aspergillus fumigatus]KAH2389117.1 hypothetical protein KXW92_002331 [Aspergillus fumigatus]
MSPRELGFIGLGLEDGARLHVYDVDDRALRNFEAEAPTKGRVCSNAREVAESSVRITTCKSREADQLTNAAPRRFLFTMVPEGRHVRSVYLDSHAGVLTTSVDDKILVDCSTIDTATSMDVGAAVCQNSKTAAFYDAPVSGGSLGAVAGTLTFMVGCVEDDPNLELLQALLRSMGASIFPCGGFLLGLTAKLCNNYCSGLIAIATAEAMNIGIKSGMKPSLLARVFATSTAQSTINDKWNPVPGCLSECPGEQGDLALAVEAADRVGAQLRLGVPALQVYQEAREDERCHDLDSRVVFRYIGGDEDWETKLSARG